MIITIDGPVASGKSTIARLLAQVLDYYYINSGMIFRALSFALINDRDSYDLAELTYERIEKALSRIEYYYEPSLNTLNVYIDGNEVSSILKTPEIDRAASVIGVNLHVRDALAEYQRQLAEMYKNVVVEGRDAGTNVFPDADYKFFLTADPEVRAQRWIKDMARIGKEYSLDAALKEINERDARDRNRKYAPLKMAFDAIEINNSDLDKQETLQAMLEVIKG